MGRLYTVFTVLFTLHSVLTNAQSVGIGTTTPNPNAILHLQVPNAGNPQGFLLPTMSSAQRTSMSLAAADEGMLVYDVGVGQVYQWNGASWSSLGGVAATDTDWQVSPGVVYNTSDNIGIGVNSPVYPLEALTGSDTITIYAVNSMASNTTSVIKAEYTGGGTVDPVAVQGICTSTANGYGYGGRFFSNFVGVDAKVDAGAYNAFEVYGTFSEAEGTAGDRTGVLAQALGGTNNVGLQALALYGANNVGIDVVSDGIGINARSQDMTGSGVAVYADYNAGTAIGIGVAAIGYLGTFPPTTAFDVGLFASCDPAWGWAIYTDGDVHVNGTLSKAAGSFKIDHPLDPENKYLIHSFVESPDMMNVYNGNVTTDATGEAVVQLPEYFEALNTDYRYQLTPIGQFAQVAVKDEIVGNSFTIMTDQPNVKVSWQVTGIRNDRYAQDYPIVPEVDKEPQMVGKYLYTDFNKSKSGNKSAKGSLQKTAAESKVEAKKLPSR